MASATHTLSHQSCSSPLRAPTCPLANWRRSKTWRDRSEWFSQVLLWSLDSLLAHSASAWKLLGFCKAYVTWEVYFTARNHKTSLSVSRQKRRDKKMARNAASTLPLRAVKFTVRPNQNEEFSARVSVSCCCQAELQIREWWFDTTMDLTTWILV